jgi:hypothetical protein
MKRTNTEISAYTEIQDVYACMYASMLAYTWIAHMFVRAWYVVSNILASTCLLVFYTHRMAVTCAYLWVLFANIFGKVEAVHLLRTPGLCMYVLGCTRACPITM